MHVDRWKAMWPQIEPLLDQLLDLDEPERSLALERLTADAPHTRSALRALLDTDRWTDGPLERPALSAERLVANGPPAIEPGTRLGPYVVRREIGRGGMGAVVLAERDDGQFEQRVAIKWMRPDAWAPGAHERFMAERRILARLEHPHIARLLDGGVRDDGSPFLVMEYVEGRPITTWCDERRLDARARVALFRQVCAAVEYAHSQLIIHRDLKPDHILVTTDGEVKLLDFGIAKLLDPEHAEALTRTQARVFTPAYATPEQYLGGVPTVATDEYQLALVLHELLTGRRVHGTASGSPLAHQRRVLETDPERPSRVVSRPIDGRTATGEAAALAEARATSIAGLSRTLAGDLDAILLKALEREPKDRYASVEAFRRDLECAIGDRPVAARRATFGYRARKYARRHRLALTAGALVMLSLMGGLAGVLVQARIAARERDLALAAERKATAINEFVLRELLESPTPERALGRPPTVAEVLRNASRTVGHAFAGEPMTESQVRMTLARSYQALGRPDEASVHAEAALRLLASRVPADARERLDARGLLAGIALDQGRFDEAQSSLARLVADQQRMLGRSDPATIAAEEQLGRAFAAQGRFVAAESTLRRGLANLPADERHWRLAVDLQRSLASACVERARAREAESLLTRALAIERHHLGPDHPLAAATLRQLANALAKDLRPAEASRVLREALAMSVRLNGEDHPATADVLMSLASSLDAQRLRAESLEAIERAVGIYRHTLGSDHPKTLRALRNLAVLERGAGRYDEADPIYREVYETCLRTLGPDHWQTLEALQGIVFLRLNQGRTREAAAIARRILTSRARVASQPDADPASVTDFALYLVEASPPEVRDPARAVTVAQRAVAATGGRDYQALRALGFAEAASGHPRDAIPHLREALALPDGVRSWTTEEKLVDLLTTWGAPGELERTLLDHLEQERALRGPDDRTIGKTLRHLSRMHRAAGHPVQAESLARASIAQLQKTLPPTSWEVGRIRVELGSLLVERGGYAEAESLLVGGFRSLEADPEVPAADLERARRDLVRLYRATGRSQAADRWQSHVLAARRPIDP